MTNHEFYMELALKNASAMKGQTDPNPLVGAVIVNDNRVVGIGAHLKAGEPHAEIHALRMAGEAAKGGTIYVTLEPCSHYGRTGPCAVAIVEAGIKRVVIATLDPNPVVSGNGVKILKDAGIEVIIGVHQEESQKMNEVFNKFILEKKPFVTLKSGITLDGKIATYASNSKWITSEQSRQDVHLLRNENMAILIGVNTVIKDNPELTARIPNGRNPIRVILDSTLKIPIDSKVVTDNLAETWIFTCQKYDQDKEKTLKSLGMKVFPTDGVEKVDPKDVMEILGEHLISSVLIEGGGTINASFLENKCIDKVILYFAPKLIGGKDAPTFLEGAGIEKMSDAVDLVDTSIIKIGKDFKFIGYPIYSKEGIM
ncbi:bifunctional diaminohydroxyphosphoribosylaminopyrimidine deaminase/5-amino-6-(5-phosphoribosylamino)uracil reductase RibD [Bacillus sp. ISL-40]|uniref:bifunctional diaminohydroxyphosphoribosylaminopyrimidine deaminase/5-amino-6-(5-phosphoribosylamino)uracil reductase RibD n=1 Tax=unclassified Bacillus (in: firmicutes) TaxID=185979 RepID=UPI001BE5704E|nr:MULTISPECIES: bifunctional diaminohydroxyphosphoribosylaminopyrimidine deaminase/5-amino-6-(5-phosphoribosylamino)uracil reductase RibD [unclassified Bacillus (in: firmicutes)]MBT2700186.1 bifunctional diaminohydroxyphosphoribosylaminopyrimidine deaminase/5-amino-6-(5-phosphoribosylamino)uracil reductase RibD [Bacillus sp. ISL-40]MBT2721850.1 bifunctional diaminohydroxyphosphoribosylaminopyrimidine deaminase/5-amino-6-(5-phosphoribosylamino)uracil reductase RibD [Bacillus sp. ISL-46]MBT274047